MGSAFSPLTIFATGSAQTGTNWIGKNLEASFENSAPLVFNNLEHLFMSVVPVGLAGGTTGTDNVSGFSPKGKYQVSQWSNNNGTTNTKIIAKTASTKAMTKKMLRPFGT